MHIFIIIILMLKYLIMKRLLSYSILLLMTIVVLSFNLTSKSNCSTSKTGSRNLTCGSCHGGSINTDIIIVDGLEEGNDTEGDKFFELEIFIPSNIALAAIQTNINFGNKGKLSAYSNIVKPLFEDSYGMQYPLMELKNSKKNKKENESLVFRWFPPKDFTGSHNIIVEGVLANTDGTPNGDYTFYKEISVNVGSIDNTFGIYPTVVTDNIYIKGVNNNDWVYIFDYSGKNVLKEKISFGQISLSTLSRGNYILKTGDKVGKFLKQ